MSRIFAVDIIFTIPLLLLILLAVGIAVWRFSNRGAKAAATSFVRIIVYGGFALFVLFALILAYYYSTGGH